MGETAPLRQHGESRTETPAPIPNPPPTSPSTAPATAPSMQPKKTTKPMSTAKPSIPASIPAQATGPDHPTAPRAAASAVLFRLHLPASVDAVPHTRHALRRSVRAEIAAEPLDTIELLVSELVTNAVQYSPRSTTVTVELLRGERTLRILVTDAGAPLPRPRRPARAVDEHGRGLLLVEALAQSWGCCPVPGGKIVWCDVDLAS